MDTSTYPLTLEILVQLILGLKSIYPVIEIDCSENEKRVVTSYQCQYYTLSNY